MLRSLSTGATGMIAQQNNLDVIANNVANIIAMMIALKMMVYIGLTMMMIGLMEKKKAD